MDSLRKKRRMQIGVLLAMVAVVGVMVGFNILRPAPAAPQVEVDFTHRLLDGATGRLGQDERRELQGQWERFSPESRKAIFSEVARQRLRGFRAQIAPLHPEEKQRAIRKAVENMRKQRQGLAEDEKERIRQRLTSGEARELTQNFMDFYQQDLTARERADLDPLVHEWFRQIDELLHE